MNWIDTGFLISKNKYNENSLIVEIFTKDHGKTTGIIFGGTSKKIKSYLEIKNNLHVNFYSKSSSKMGYFKIEILDVLSPLYFDNAQKLSCIISSMNLIKILTAESQTNKKIYRLILNFFKILNKNNLIKDYIFWELEILKTIGYDLELKKMVFKETINDKTQYFVKSSIEKKIVPSFLINRDEKTEDLNTLLKGLKLVGDYLEKTILKPNNLNYPITRSQFVNSLK